MREVLSIVWEMNVIWFNNEFAPELWRFHPKKTIQFFKLLENGKKDNYFLDVLIIG